MNNWANNDINKPEWFTKLSDAIAAGKRGVILRFNVNDFVAYGGPDSKNTIPTSSLKYWISRYLFNKGYHVAGYSLATGVIDMTFKPSTASAKRIEEAGRTHEVDQIFSALTRILKFDSTKNNPPIALIIDYADHLVPSVQGMNAMLSPQQLAALETLTQWPLDEDIRRTNNLIIIISHENSMHELLMREGSGYELIDVGLPTKAQRQAFITDLLEHRKNAIKANKTVRFADLEKEITSDDVARLTGGLRLRDLEEVFRLAQARNINVTREALREKKVKAINQLAQGLVEVIDPAFGFEAVAGVSHAREYFEDFKKRIERGDTSVPQAILFAGVPGCGKSYLVKAIAKELAYPLLVMRNVRDRWVGSTERNLDLVLWIAESLAPCILWIDEIDQMLGQRSTMGSTDSGVSERFLARIWEFMGSSSHRGRILWLATTNRPDILDMATLDRFQVILPFLHPTKEEIQDLVPLLASQLNRQLDENLDITSITNIISCPTVRSLQEVIGIAATLADRKSNNVGEKLLKEHLDKAADNYRQTYDPILHEFIALTCLRMTTSELYLPWKHLDGSLRNNYTLLPYLIDIIDNSTGKLLNSKLFERLNYLAGLMRRSIV